MSVDQDKLTRLMEETQRQAQNAATYNGHLGQLIKTYCEDTGTERWVIGALRKLRKMEDDGKRQSLIRNLLEGLEALDFFAQVDAFDDMRALFKRLAEGKPEEAPAAGGQALDELAEGAGPAAADNGASKLHDLGKVRERKGRAAAAGEKLH